MPRIFGQMSDVTHLAYAALSEKPGIFEGWVDRAQMEVNLTMLRKSVRSACGRGEKSSPRFIAARHQGLRCASAPDSDSSAARRRAASPHENFLLLQEDYFCAPSRPARIGTSRFCGLRSSSARRIAQSELIPPLRRVRRVACAKRAARSTFPGGNPLGFRTGGYRSARAPRMNGRRLPTGRAQRTSTSPMAMSRPWQDLWPVVADALGMESARRVRYRLRRRCRSAKRSGRQS